VEITDVVFWVINGLPLPIWLTWMCAPRSRASRWLATSVWPWIVFGGVYVVLIVLPSFVYVTPGAAMDSLDGVMAIFAGPWGALTGWMHYIAFDSFVGRWIMNDAPEAGYRLLPFLFFTMLLGPIGLMAYLMMRDGLRSTAAVNVPRI
jgi:hypothetical protein